MYRPRLSVEITDHQANRLRELIPHGLRGALFQAIVEDIIGLLEEHGSGVLTVIIDRKIRARECLATLQAKGGESQ